MICFDCGHQVSTAWRQFRLPKRGVGIGKYQDVCEECYEAAMVADGYTLTKQEDGCMAWSKQEARHG